MTAVGDPPRPAPGAPPALGQFVRARTTPAKLDAARRQQLTAEILGAALDAEAAGQTVGDGRLLGCETAEVPLRSGLEQSYRALARLAPDQGRRIELVDRANEVRPRTWL